MRPFMVIIGILLGSCLAITASLAAVLFVFAVLGDEHPQVQHEITPLIQSTLIFLTMTLISAASFYTLLKKHPARFWTTAIMLTGLAATVWYFLP